MSFSDGESIYITKLKLKGVNENNTNIDTVVSDIPDMKGENARRPNPKNSLFYLPDEEVINARQDVKGVSIFFKSISQQDLEAMI